MTLTDSSTEASAAAGRILCRRDDAVARVTISHAGRMNAVTVAMWRELRACFDALSALTDVRCIVVEGAEGNFAAGADIREFPDVRRDAASVEDYHRNILAPALSAIARCPHPVVARIRGVCVGAGLEIAAQCDLRLGSESARLGVPINRLGFPMAPDEMRGLLALAGHAVTMELLLEGRILAASEACAKGLLTRVVPDAALDAEVECCVARILAGAPLAARLNKRMAVRLGQATMLHEDEYREFFSYAPTRDHHEGVRAFLAGETPTFNGD